MEKEPLVSVVIPFYSGKEWLDQALESVLAQDYNNKEVIVINDGSNEDIEEIKKKYNGTVQFIKKENEGPASARNLGIELSNGKYIAFLDSDDLWLQNKLKKQISLMEEKNAVWSQHSYEMFWEEAKKTKVVDTSIYEGNVYRDCFISFKIQTSCVIVRRQILIKDNIRFPINKRYGQDCELYRSLAKKYELYSMSGVYSKFRIRGNNAGFRAIVQINDRADNWKILKADKTTLNSFPFLVRLAYKICEKESNFIENKHINNEGIAKMLYLFPWILFRIYAKNRKEINK